MALPTLGEQLLGDAGGSTPRIAGRFDGDHVLVPLLSDDVRAVTDQLEVAVALARPTGAALTVTDPFAGADRESVTYDPETVDTDAVRAEALDRDEEPRASLAGEVRWTRDAVGGVLSTVGSGDVDTLVLPSEGGIGRVRTGVTTQIAAHADCDVAVVNGRAGYGRVASILLAVADGPHSGLAADVTRSVAADCDAWVDVLHVVGDDPDERRRRRATDLVDDVCRRIGRPETTTRWVLERDDVAAAIAEQSRYYGLTVLGAPTKGRLRRLVAGSTNRSVRANARSVVLSVRNQSGD